MLGLVRRSAATTHEDVFLARYAALVLVALRVTEGNRVEAEDVVHEAFIRFTLVQPPLDDIQNLDAYLSRMLRNMYTSRIRRRKSATEVSLSILDYDSFDIGSSAIDASQRLEVREMLGAACEYGCRRKRSSKVGSVFLLRFFHGYLPSEIARLARLSSAIVDALVFRARREVKAYVEHPDELAGIDRPGPRAPTGHHERDLVDELRARMFSDTHRRCWSKTRLRDMYGDQADAISRDDLADLVGCPTCLDAASVLLGLPRLADRWPTDTLGPGSRGGPGGGPVTGLVAAGRRRARTVFEHRPRALSVAVNGFVLGYHTVGADESELTLSVNVDEPIAAIEVFSEQGLCLAFLDTCPPPDGDARQGQRVDLSDGRHVRVDVEFAGPWPTVRASYSDPRPPLLAHLERELPDEAESVTERQPVLEIRRQPRRLFGSRLAWLGGVTAIAIWLLFWTPGTTVSAAARLANTIRWLVAAVLGSSAPATIPAPSPASPPRSEVEPDRSPTRAVVPTMPARLTPAQRVDLELEALAALQQVDAYLGQEVSLVTRETGPVEVQGVVDTTARQAALLAALGPLVTDADITARITTLDALAARRRPSSPVRTEARSFQFAGDEFPMFATVRRYLLHQEQFQRGADSASSAVPVDEGKLDADARRFAIELLGRSRRAAQHAWALKHLADRFPASVLGAGSDEARASWRSLVREHARAFQQEMVLLRRDLEPIVRPADATATPNSPADTPTADAWTHIDQLLDAHRRHELAIQRAFAIQSGALEDVDAVDSAAFRELMERCETLAAAIAIWQPSR